MTVLTNTRDAHAMDLKADVTFYSPKSITVARRNASHGRKSNSEGLFSQMLQGTVLSTKWSEIMRKQVVFPDA
jgi:hypothetical protein